MISVEIPAELERQFLDVVNGSYHGNIREALSSLLFLHDKYGWKEQLGKDVRTIRAEVKKKGGIKVQTIDDAVIEYRKKFQ